MQSINFTMLAPSGAGGAYFTELLDDNWSVEGTQNKDNNRCSKTNEYAGSPNSFRIDDYNLLQIHILKTKITIINIFLKFFEDR